MEIILILPVLADPFENGNNITCASIVITIAIKGPKDIANTDITIDPRYKNSFILKALKELGLDTTEIQKRISA